MLILALVIVLFAADYGIRLFITEPDAARFGTDYLKMIAFFYPFLGVNFILNGTVRAAGAMIQVLILNIVSFWILRYPATYYLSGLLGEKGIALAWVSALLSAVSLRSFIIGMENGEKRSHSGIEKC